MKVCGHGLVLPPRPSSKVSNFEYQTEDIASSWCSLVQSPGSCPPVLRYYFSVQLPTIKQFAGDELLVASLVVLLLR
jgi:hypothetical protein